MKMKCQQALVIVGILLMGCESAVNQAAFHPDTVSVLPQDKLPDGVETFSIKTEDNVNIQGLYLPLASAEKIVIYFHGNAGNIYHRIPSLSQLRQFGVNVVGVSYRGYGKSEGTPSEEGIYRDGAAMLKYVSESLGFDQRNIVLLGRSIGSTVAVHTAQHADIGGLILVTPLTSGKAQAEAGGMGFMASFAGDAFNNLAKIKYVNAPLLVIHGTHDRVIPYSMGKALFDQAQTQKRFVSIAGADHNNLQDDFAQEYWLPIGEFLRSL